MVMKQIEPNFGNMSKPSHWVLFDFHISKDEASFFDFWKNGTGVSFHIGKYRLDLCLCSRRYRYHGFLASQHPRRRAPDPWRR